HCCWRRSTGVSLRRPSVKREQGNENAEPDEQKEVRPTLRSGGNDTARGKALQLGEIEGAHPRRNREIQIKHTDQQNKTAQRKVDGDFPGGCMSLASAPKSDQEKRRD